MAKTAAFISGSSDGIYYACARHPDLKIRKIRMLGEGVVDRLIAVELFSKCIEIGIFCFHRYPFYVKPLADVFCDLLFYILNMKNLIKLSEILKNYKKINLCAADDQVMWDSNDSKLLAK